MREIQPISGLRDLIDGFDNFLIDQYGVLHDGIAPYPGAVEALLKLKEASKSVMLLSNSGRRSAPNEQRLEKLGFPKRSWSFFLSSGEVAWRHLAQTAHLKGSLKCLLISRGGDRSAVEGLPIDLVNSGADAEIVLISGSDGDHFDLDHYRQLLAPAAAASVPCFCSNPDKLMLTPVGSRFGAGRIAEAYVELGGAVTWIGKPFEEIYDVAKKMLGEANGSRTICIGDSIEHDIAGGAGAGLQTALVTTGVLSDLSPDQRKALFQQHDAQPDFLLSSFVW